ncbi:MAG: hypothetical protein ACYDEE_12995 [Ignavibacteriaceae bacterium]
MKTYCFLLMLFLFSVSYSTAQTKSDALLVMQVNKNYNTSNGYLKNFMNDQSSKKIISEKREPGHAMLISALWPGLGQFYNGPTETTKGTIMAVGQGGLLLLAIIGALNPSEGSVGGGSYSGGTLSYDVKTPSINPLVWVGIIGMLGNSIYSMIDAGNRAKELNAEEGLSFQINMFNNMPHLVGKSISNDFGANISFKINL